MDLTAAVFILAGAMFMDPVVVLRSRPASVSRRKWATPRAGLARLWQERSISTSPVPAAMNSSG